MFRPLNRKCSINIFDYPGKFKQPPSQPFSTLLCRIVITFSNDFVSFFWQLVYCKVLLAFSSVFFCLYLAKQILQLEIYRANDYGNKCDYKYSNRLVCASVYRQFFIISSFHRLFFSQRIEFDYNLSIKQCIVLLESHRQQIENWQKNHLLFLQQIDLNNEVQCHELL